MLTIDVTDLLNVNDEDLAHQIKNAGGIVRVTVSVPALYCATTRTELAMNWLTVWYTAERLAERALSATCTAKEGELGAGELVFSLATDDPVTLAVDLIEFAAVHGGEDLEASASLIGEAEAWLSKRGDAPVWFPGLEQNYRKDAAQAREHEGYSLDDDEGTEPDD